MAGRRLHELRDAGADGHPLRRLDHEQIEALALEQGDHLYLGTFNRGRLGLIGRITVSGAEAGTVIAGAPLAQCDFGVEVPHETARALRFADGTGLRFARVADYELHPRTLLRPLELSEKSAGDLEGLVLPAPQGTVPDAPRPSPIAGVGPHVRAGRRDEHPELDSLGLSTRAHNILGRLGITSLEELEALTEERLLATPNAGTRTVSEIQSKLAARGMALANASHGGGSGLHAEHSRTPAPDTALDDVPFSARARNVLGRLNVSTVQELADCSEQRLLEVPGAGATTLDEIRTRLGAYGVRLADAEGQAKPRDGLMARAATRALQIESLRRRGLTLGEIAKRYGVSLERTRQMLSRTSAFDSSGVAPAGSTDIPNPLQARAGEITARWASGADIADLAREEGVGRHSVAEVILGTATPADRANHAAAAVAARRSLAVYSDSQLIDGLKRATAELRHRPSAVEYDDWAASHDGVARTATVVQRFEGWYSALHAAGLSEQGSSPRSDRRWTRDACLAAVRLVFRETNAWPTMADYKTLASRRDDLPSAATLRNRLGPWTTITTIALRGEDPSGEPLRSAGEPSPGTSEATQGSGCSGFATNP